MVPEEEEMTHSYATVAVKAEKHADAIFYLLHGSTGLAFGTYLTSSKAVIVHSLMFPATDHVMSCNVVNYKKEPCILFHYDM